MAECEHGNTALGYYAHPEKDEMVVYCVECYLREHPLKTAPFITRYGQKLLDKKNEPQGVN